MMQHVDQQDIDILKNVSEWNHFNNFQLYHISKILFYEILNHLYLNLLFIKSVHSIICLYNIMTYAQETGDFELLASL